MALTLSVSPTTGIIEFDANGIPVGTLSIDTNNNINLQSFGNASVSLNNGVVIDAGGLVSFPSYTNQARSLPGLIGGILECDTSGILSVTGAANATALGWTTARKLTLTGNLSGVVSIDGSTDVELDATLPDIISGGTELNLFTVNTKGLITAAKQSHSLLELGITDAVYNAWMKVGSSDVYYTLPDRANNYYSSNSVKTGIIDVVLPVSFNNSFVSIDILVVELSTGKQVTVNVAGKLDQTQNRWLGTASAIFGDTSIVSVINVGGDSSFCHIYLSNVTGSWNGLSVLIKTVLATNTNQDKFNAGYGITVINSVPAGITASLVTPSISNGTNTQLLNNKDATFYRRFDSLTNLPNTLAGYGITDALSATAGGIVSGSVTIGVQGGTQKLSVPNGSATAPSISVISDATTGICFGSINSKYLSLISNGLEAFSVLSQNKAAFGGSTLTHSIVVQSNIVNGNVINGAALTLGGAWVNGNGNTIQTNADSNYNGATSLVLGIDDYRARFIVTYLPNTGSATYTAIPVSLLEVWPPQPAANGIAANHVRITAATTTNSPIIDVAGQDANINLVLAAQGTGSLIINSPLQFNSNIITSDANVMRLGANNTVSPLTRLSVHPAHVDMLSVGITTNTFPTLHITSPDMNQIYGAIESGIRSGLQIDWLVSDNRFVGTLESQRALWLRHGNYVTSGSGVINNSIGLFIEMPGGGNTVTTNSWGIYQTSVYAATQNYLYSPLIIGASPSGITNGEMLLVKGAARTTGLLTVQGSLHLQAGLVSVGAHKSTAGNAQIQTYRNVADYVNAASAVTGSMKITLPFGWSNTTLLMKMILLFNYGTPSLELTVTGSNQSNGPWVNISAFSAQPVPGSSVRFAYDGAKCCLLIGTTSTVWNYPTALISEVVTAFNNVDGWESGWNITIIASEAGLLNISPAILLS